MSIFPQFLPNNIQDIEFKNDASILQHNTSNTSIDNSVDINNNLFNNNQNNIEECNKDDIELKKIYEILVDLMIVLLLLFEKKIQNLNILE